MKKKLLFLLVVIACSSMFAQVSGSKLFVGVTNFAQEASDTWKIYDADFSVIDPVADHYKFDGGFVVKLLGFSRYNFTCDVVKQNNDFVVKLTNVTSFVCDKNGVKMTTSKIVNTSDRVADAYASQMKDEILKRMEAISEEDAKASLLSFFENPKNKYSLGNEGDFVEYLKNNGLFTDDVISNPLILSKISKNTPAGDFASFLYENNLIENENVVNSPLVMVAVASNVTNDLQFERYLTKTGLIGKEITLPIIFEEIKKNDLYMINNSNYYVLGEGESCIVTCFTNDDRFVDYKPNKEIKITGKIQSVKFNSTIKVLSIYMTE